LPKGIEVDILEGGRLDHLPDKVLAQFDIGVLVVCSQFGLSRAKQADRIVRVKERPYSELLAIPGGRLAVMLRVLCKAWTR